MDSGGAARTLSKQELRKQKLMEYLAEKGRLRDPNSKPYLKEKSAKPKKLTETFVKVPCVSKSVCPSVEGKENQKTDPPTQRWRENKTQIPGAAARAPLRTTGLACITHNGTVRSTSMARISRCCCTSPSLDKVCRDKAGPSGSHPRAGGRGPTTTCTSSSHPTAAGPSGSRSSTAPVELRQPGGVASASSWPNSIHLDRRSHNAGTVQSKTLVTVDLPVRTAMRPNLRKTASSKALAAAATPSVTDVHPSSTMRSKSDLASVSSKSLPGTCQRKAIPPVRQQSPASTTSSVTPVANKHCGVYCKGASDPTGSKDFSSEPLLIRPQRKAAADPAAPRKRDAVLQPRTSHRVAGPRTAKDQAPSRARGSALHKVVLQAISKTGKETSLQIVSRVSAPESDSGVPKSTRMRNKTTGAAQPCTSNTRQLKEQAVLNTPDDQSQTNKGDFATASGNGQQKSITAQEERLRKLQEWRKAKGIFYKRPPMPIKPSLKKAPTVPQHYWSSMEAEDEAQHLVCTIDSALADCMKLLQEGCPTEQVTALLSRLPVAQKFAKYWICQAWIMERAGNLEVLPLFEQAVQAVLEPLDELRAVVFEILKKKEEVQAKATEEEPKEQMDIQEEGEVTEMLEMNLPTPKATSVLIHGAKEGSSVVKYKITATPGGRKSQKQDSMYLDGQELRFFTPVRRSVRIERSVPRYPAALQEHDPCVASYRDLLAEEQDEGHLPIYVYRENEALGDQVQFQFV